MSGGVLVSVSSVVVPQALIHHVSLPVKQVVETSAEEDARAVAVPGCTARRASEHARRHVAGLRYARNCRPRSYLHCCLRKAALDYKATETALCEPEPAAE